MRLHIFFNFEPCLVQVKCSTIPVAHPYLVSPTPPSVTSSKVSCYIFILWTFLCQNCYIVEALPMDTHVSGQLFLRLPSQNPVFLNSHINSLSFHSLKQPALVTDTFLASWGCLLTRASTVLTLKIIVSFLFTTLTKPWDCIGVFSYKTSIEVTFTWVCWLYF